MGTNFYEYTTLQGDTFDMIALDAYNDEFQAYRVIQANPQHAGVIVFDAGVKLKVPIIAPEAAATLPPWKR